MWILLSLTGALFQSVTGAINKRNLDISKSAINIIAFINYFFAGICLAIFFYFQTGQVFPEIKNHLNFWYGILITVPFNVIGAYFGYRALQLAEYNYVAPWLTLSTILIVIPSFLLLHELPTTLGLIGIAIVVSGAILMDYKKRRCIDDDKDEKELRQRRNKIKLYILIIGICYTITPVGMKMAILESSPVFVAVVAHLAIALTFLMIIFLFERRKFRHIFSHLDINEKYLFFALALIAGAGYAIANGSINIALGLQQTAMVMGVKRVAPVFAFFIGYIFLRERRDAKKKLLATILIVIGTILLAVFK